MNFIIYLSNAMNNKSLHIRIALFAVLAITCASRTFAASVNSYLILKDAKGKIIKVPVADDGTFASPALPKGTYSFQWEIGRGITSSMAGSADRSMSPSSMSPSPSNRSGSTGAASMSIKPQKIIMTYGVMAPRDPHSGMATGKRMHATLTIIKEIDKSTPLYRCVFNPLVIDADCGGITGKIQWQAADGKSMSMDEWRVDMK
jgi:hypothetical protein